jgi:hypothetical protein
VPHPRRGRPPNFYANVRPHHRADRNTDRSPDRDAARLPDGAATAAANRDRNRYRGTRDSDANANRDGNEYGDVYANGPADQHAHIQSATPDVYANAGAADGNGHVLSQGLISKTGRARAKAAPL